MQKSDQFEEVMLNVKWPRGKNKKTPNLTEILTVG